MYIYENNHQRIITSIFIRYRSLTFLSRSGPAERAEPELAPPSSPSPPSFPFLASQPALVGRPSMPLASGRTASCQFCYHQPPEIRHPPRARCYIRDDTASPAKLPPEPLSEVLERVAKLPPAAGRQESPRKQVAGSCSTDCRSISR